MDAWGEGEEGGAVIYGTTMREEDIIEVLMTDRLVRSARTSLLAKVGRKGNGSPQRIPTQCKTSIQSTYSCTPIKAANNMYPLQRAVATYPQLIDSKPEDYEYIYTTKHAGDTV